MYGKIAVIALSTALVAPRAPAQVKTRTDSMRSRDGSYTTTRNGVLSDSVVHLSSRDSVEWQSFGPLHITGRPEGLLVTYYPFFSLADSARVRRTALVFFDSLRSRFTNGEPPYIVLRAVNLRARDRDNASPAALRAFGVVLEKHTDGHWYLLESNTPIRP